MDAKNLLANALDVVSSLLAPKPGQAEPQKRTLENITMDELQREKVRIDQEERKLLMRIRELETSKKTLFDEGVRNSSEREQIALARKIKDVDDEAKNLDRQLQFFSKQRRIINGFIQIKDNQRILSQSGLSSIISDVDLQTLQTYVDQASVDGEFTMGKFSNVIRTLDQADSVINPEREDEGVMQIFRAMQQTRESADGAQLVTGQADGQERPAAGREKPEAH